MHRKSSSKYSKAIVLLCFITIIIFTIACLVFAWNEKDVPTALIGCFFACFGIEFGSLAFIKRGEYKYVSGATVGHIERIEDNDA